MLRMVKKVIDLFYITMSTFKKGGIIYIFIRILEHLKGSKEWSFNKEFVHKVEYNGRNVYYRAFTSDTVLLDTLFLGADGNIQYNYDLGFKPDVILDLGANIGLFSVKMAHEYPESEIIAVEPEKSNYEILKKNSSFYKNIKCVQGGIWYREKDLTIINPYGEKWGFICKEAEKDEASTIHGVTIDSLIDIEGKSGISLLIKMDIEGTEKVLFENINEALWINHVTCLIIEIHDKLVPGVRSQIIEEMVNRGFTIEEDMEDTIFKKQDGF